VLININALANFGTRHQNIFKVTARRSNSSKYSPYQRIAQSNMWNYGWSFIF